MPSRLPLLSQFKEIAKHMERDRARNREKGEQER